LFEMMQLVNFGLFFFKTAGGNGKLMFTYIDDVVSAIMCSIRAPPSALDNTYIICPDDYLTYHQWIDQIALELGRAPPLFQLPINFVKLVIGVIGPVLNIGRRRIFAAHSKTIERMKEDRWYSNAKAKRELGYQPKYNLQESLRLTIRRHLDDGALKKYPISPLVLITTFVVLGVSMALYVLM